MPGVFPLGAYYSRVFHFPPSSSNRPHSSIYGPDCPRLVPAFGWPTPTRHTRMAHPHSTPEQHTRTVHPHCTPARHTRTAHPHGTPTRHTRTAHLHGPRGPKPKGPKAQGAQSPRGPKSKGHKALEASIFQNSKRLKEVLPNEQKNSF